MLPKFKSSEFIYSFESKGVTLLFEDIVGQYYMYRGEWIDFVKDDKSIHFSSKETIDRLRKEGESRTPEQTIQAANRVRGSIRKAREINIKEEISFDYLLYILNAMKEACRKYEYFDFNYWENVFQKNDEKSSENIKLVQDFKNQVREELNPIFFEKSGLLYNLLGKLSDQFDIPRADLDWYTIQDIKDIFNGKRVSDDEINRRKKAFILVGTEDTQCALYSGDEALKIFEPFKQKIDYSSKILKGKTANKGKIVRARVKVISRDYADSSAMQKEMDEMDKGDILVSETTEPALMDALRKASAIVTDVGGMLSHAAITARELDKPCIVDTQIASKILRDGDLVEVDTEKGIIKILK